MPFQKGQRLPNQGGNHGGAGRPSREQTDFKQKLLKAIDRHACRKANEIADKYVSRALGEQGDKVLMHLVDKALPAAKTQIELTGKNDGPIETQQSFDVEGYKAAFGELLKAHESGNGNGANGLISPPHNGDRPR